MTSEKITIEAAAEFLLEHDRYTILSHANPDGDTAGCACGLCIALRSIGKKANVRCAEPFSERFGFMTAAVPDEEFEEETVISVDVADRLLLGELDGQYGGRVELAIDHHLSHVCFEKRLLNEPTAAACAQTVFKVIKAMKIPLNKDIAACLYTAVATDSGCFKFSSVTPETHRIAAELLEFDFGFAQLNYVLFDLKTRERLALEERIYREMEYYFDGKCAEIPDIISECDKAGNSDLVYEFCSTSKITFPGSGISAVASSPANLIDIRAFLKFATIGPDKINQLRHARFFRNSAGLRAHMKKHAAIMKPKFDAMYKVLNEELDGLGIAEWTVAKGGYFASYDTLPGCARAVVEMAAEHGVKFTPAGATYPHGNDPQDSNIRLAPSFPTPEELAMATDLFVLCVKIVSVEKLLKEA